MTEQSAPMDFFPYDEPRKGQEEMMNHISDKVRSGHNIVCEAPNGFGKTCATLCGVLPWVLENSGKVLYCARTHRQLDRVMEELDAISKRQCVTGVSFRGRRHMCLNPFVLENAGFFASISEVCGQLKATGKCAYYERTKKAVDSANVLDIMPSGVLTAPDIVGIAKKRAFCPYELAKKLAKVVDVVAFSYLYVFDPFVMEVFMPELEIPLGKIVLIQDEAHNIPSTALDSASDSLPVGTVRQAIREATTYHDTISKDFCRELAKVILENSTEMKEDDEKMVDPEVIFEIAIMEAGMKPEDEVISHMKSVGASIRRGLLKAGKFPRSTIHRVADFMLKWVEYSKREDYTFMIASARTSRESRRVSLDLVALDPTVITNPILRMVRSSVAISGTLSPLDAFSEMIGLGPETAKLTFHNPFAKRNRLAMIVEGVGTSYKTRSDALFSRMVDHCVAVAHATPGNTGIFTTSYAVGGALLKAGLEKRLRKKLYSEKQGMKTSDNDTLIEEFKARGDMGGAVLLGVQGGRNSEGGDFPGSTMESVIVVGVPYARPTLRTDALIQYFDKRFNRRGRDYAYVLPSMTRAVQAAGRPVRRLEDRGAIILLDQRFATSYLRRFMPKWLDEVTQVMPDSPDMVAQQVEAFFSD